MPLFVLLLFITLSSFTYASSSTPVNELTICWEKELKPPYLTLDTAGQPTGIAVEWLTTIFAAQNIKLVNKLLPWKRCLKELKLGNVDIVPNASFKLSRTQIAHYSAALYTTHLYLYYTNKLLAEKDLTQAAAFAPYKVGGVNGFNYGFLDDAFNIDTAANTRRSLLKKLLKGRLDFAIMQREVYLAIRTQDQASTEPLKAVPSPITHQAKYFVLISKKHPRAESIKENFNIQLRKLRVSGQYLHILKKYTEPFFEQKKAAN